MRIALVNIFRPREGSGDGITEYTYQLYNRLKGRHSIDLFYALEQSKRLDVFGRVYAEIFFRSIVKKLLSGNYDVIHITNPEIGYFSKNLKKEGAKAKIIVTIHDFIRIVSNTKGSSTGLQTFYDSIITRNTKEAVDYSDYIIFASSYEMKYGEAHYHLPAHSLIFLGGKDSFLKTSIPKKHKNGIFTTGYIGGLVKSRNIPFILKTAQHLGPEYKFKIYGNGQELPELKKYKEENHLENVEFMGFAPEKEILNIYDSLNAFMNCSDVDAASLPVEDALARGVPVIIAKKNVYDEELKRRVYEADTPEDAAAIIKKLNKEGYPKSKHDAVLKYSRSISWANTAKKTETVYKKLIK